MATVSSLPRNAPSWLFVLPCPSGMSPGGGQWLYLQLVTLGLLHSPPISVKCQHVSSQNVAILLSCWLKLTTCPHVWPPVTKVLYFCYVITPGHQRIEYFISDVFPKSRTTQAQQTKSLNLSFFSSFPVIISHTHMLRHTSCNPGCPEELLS